LENILTDESAQVSADMGVSIDYQNIHITFVVNRKLLALRGSEVLVNGKQIGIRA
jgi:hypothetical protein